MVQYEWNEETCRRYADKMEKVVKHDHRPWARRIVERLDGLPSGARVMDVATGPGFLLVELARLLPDAVLYAQDEAEPMLALARERAAGLGVELETVHGPAERIGLDDGVVDVVTCKQLLHECRDVDDVVREIHRVLAPDSRATPSARRCCRPTSRRSSTSGRAPTTCSSVERAYLALALFH